ncbi:MAG: YybH family protein [Bacteroidota bacterium]
MEPNSISELIIGMERAALDRWCSGDPSGYLEITAQDVTYFDPLLEQRLDGLEALTKLYESIRGKIFVDSYELINPQVQVYGESAVLTFNYAACVGSNESRWNCCEVYTKIHGDWKIVHTHWSMTKALK